MLKRPMLALSSPIGTVTVQWTRRQTAEIREALVVGLIFGIQPPPTDD
jgi:hypothetical protein